MHYRLSDLYTVRKHPFQMELILKVININTGCNEELANRCEELRGYRLFVDKVRQYRRAMELEAAIDRAMGECIEENVLKTFFMENRKEIVTMSLWEFDQEKYDAMLLEEGEMRGRAAGRAEERSMMNRLTACLLEDHRMEDLKASLQDMALQNQLLREYCLV